MDSAAAPFGAFNVSADEAIKRGASAYIIHGNNGLSYLRVGFFGRAELPGATRSDPVAGIALAMSLLASIGCSRFFWFDLLWMA